MQRTICSGYQPTQSRTEESIALIQAQNVHNVTTGGTVSQQLHWKRKILNKQGLNKCRQNPTRQAAVRSFKKYHFTNQDFLLRKYLRSVKKEMRPKQGEMSEASSSVTSVTTSVCSNLSRPLANSNCVRQKNDVKSKSCSIIRNSNSSCTVNSNNTVNSTPSSTAGSSTNGSNKAVNSKNSQHQDSTDVSSMHQPINIDDELKICERKNWPTCGVEQPTYEIVLQESPPFIVCNNEIKGIINESTVYIKQYCESIKQLADIVECSEYKYDDNVSDNSTKVLPKRGRYKGNNGCINRNNNWNDKTKNNSNRTLRGEAYVNSLHVNGNSKSNHYKDYLRDNFQVNGNRYGYDDDEDNEDDEDEDEDDDYGDEGDRLNNVEDNDDDDEDNEDDDDEVDDEDDDDDEEDEDYSSGNDIDCKYSERSSRRKRIRDVDKIKRSVNSNKSVTISKDKRKSKSVDERKSLVVSLDTSDSSSVSSSQDNSSVSTETCCSDIQTITLHESEDQTRSGDLNDCVAKSKQQTNCMEQSRSFVKIRNREYPVTIFDNNPSIIEYTKGSSQLANKRREFVGLSANKKCDVQSLMCDETEDNTADSLCCKSNIPACSKTSDCSLYNKPVNAKVKSKRTDFINQLPGYITVNDSKKHSKVYKDKPVEHLKHAIESRKMNAMQAHTRSSNRSKERQKLSAGKSKSASYEALLSTVCSVEDGLAFLDNQDQEQTTSVPHISSSSQHNETITLYNNLTSCTVPVLGSTASDVSSVSKSNVHDQKSHSFPNSVASQTTSFSSATSNQYLSSFSSNQQFCSQCKSADVNLRESLQDSLMQLNDLFKSTVILNSLLTGQCQKDVIKDIVNLQPDMI